MRAVVLAKGFGGHGSQSEEFRLVLPEEPTGSICSRLSRIDWADHLAPLYERTAEDLSRQYGVLLSEDEFGVFCVAPTNDRYGRRSVVMVGLVSDRDVGSAVELAATSLERVRRGIHDVASAIPKDSRPLLEKVASQVETSPVPELPESETSSSLLRVLLETRSYSGAATPLMLGLGADVVVGTSYEAIDAERKGRPILAYFDVRKDVLVPLRPTSESEHLVPQQRREREASDRKKSASRRPIKTRDLVEELIDRLDRIEEELKALRDGQKRILDRISRRWF